MFIAIIALAVFGVPEKALPVVTYSARRLTSSDRRRPDAGAGRRQHVFARASSCRRPSAPRESCTSSRSGLPGGRIERRHDSRGTCSRCSRPVPIPAPRAMRPARSRPSNSTGVPVIRASGCGSVSVFQISSPVLAESAYAVPWMSPKKIASRGSVRAEPADREPAPHGRLRAEAPVQASGFRVERIDVAGIRRHIQPPVVHRLAVQRRRAGKPERPLQLQTRHLSGRQPGGRAWLEPRVPVVDAPAVPGRRIRLAHRRMTRAQRSASSRPRRPRSVSSLRPADPFGDQPLVLIAQRGGGVSHRAGRHDLEDVLRRHLLEHRRLRRLVARARCSRGTRRSC